jgi:PAS domain-containing protein
MTAADKRVWPSVVSEMGSLIRGMDWSATPIGVVDRWPQALRSTVDLMLATPVPMIVLWGRERIQIFNDAAVPLLGEEHPRALGMPAGPYWHEQWDLDPQALGNVLAGRPQVFEGRFHLTSKEGTLTPGWYTLSFSPLVDDASN